MPSTMDFTCPACRRALTHIDSAMGSCGNCERINEEAISVLRGLDKQKVLLPRSVDSMKVLDLKDRAKKLLKEIEASE